MQLIDLPYIEEKPIIIEHIAYFSRKQFVPTDSSSFEEAVNSYISFILVESGTALVSLGEKNYILESGNIIFIPPCQFHILKSADGQNVSYIYASFTTNSNTIKKLLSKPIRFNSTYYNYLTIALDNAELALSNFIDNANLVASSIKETNANKFNHTMQITYNCLELFLLFLSSNVEMEPVKASHKQTRHANITASVEEYLKERIKENISLQETAQHFGYSVSNIQKIFKAVTGQSIIVYFNKLKLEEAKRLIVENSMTFSQISSYLSFSNPNYFSRIFKTTVGMTPTEYANLHQKESSHDALKKQKFTSKNTSKRSKLKNL